MGQGHHRSPRRVVRFESFCADGSCMYAQIDFGGYRAIRCNWVVFGIASLFLWIVTICTLTVLDEAGNSKPVAEFDIWKSWIAQNFDWCAPRDSP